MNEDENSPLLAAIGNPNLDITIVLRDDDLIKKYDLQFERTKTVDEDFLQNIETDFRSLNPEIRSSPGGCAQNTLRVFQWLIDSKISKTSMIGSIGTDDKGKFLVDELKRNGVFTCYTSKNDYKTGHIFLFIYKKDVAAVYGAKCLASWQYSLNDFWADENALGSVKKSKILLLEGFFVIHCDEVGKEAIKIATKHNTITSFNICGEYVAERYPHIVNHYVKSCQIVIGNQAEFLAVCKSLNVYTENFEKSLLTVFQLMMDNYVPTDHNKIESMNEHKKILIVTCGRKHVYCVSGSHNLIKYVVPLVEEEMVKDTIGAGDSFLAGFFYGLIQNFSLMKCLKSASKISAEIVQQRGCVVPEKCPSSILGC